jgi:single-stranded-DNA-specific exonuclease
LAHTGWPGGVVGIVANKLVDKYHKPAILFNEADGVLRGSARSVEGLHITEAIATQSGILRGFGGHPMAAGMALDADKLDAFRFGLGKAIEKQLGEVVRAEPTLHIDAWLTFDQLHFDLANALETLAPFGAGNPSLILATRNVELKSVATIGKTKEHVRLNVADEKGNAYGLLWWGGAGETLPEAGTKFDVAYSLRTSTFRGEKRLTLQFEAFRVVEERPVEIASPQIEVRDLRLQNAPLENVPAHTLIWAEGADKDKGKSRVELMPADEFFIYTAPPSYSELKKALEIVQPKIVYVHAAPPAEEKAEEFLTRLTGLCKYTVNAYAGQITLQKFAGAMAARENAIRLGLEWLNAAGHFTVAVEEEQIRVAAGSGVKNPYLQAELFVALRGVLNETAAYRKYVAGAADLKNLFNA